MRYPSSVTHYTSLDVLDKLFNSALSRSDGTITFHLSNITMMNDAGEGELLLSQFFTDSIKKAKLKKEWDTDFYPNHTPFVLSTIATDVVSRNRGSLPMWKMYGNECKGALIRFKGDSFGKFCENQGLIFSECNYTSTSELSKIVADINRRNAPFSEILKTSCFTKQQCWQYEKEWRVVVFGSIDTIKTKCTNRGIIEYVQLNIPLDLIEEICIGPLCPKNPTLSSIEKLKQNLAQKHPGKVKFKVTKSNIPLK